MSENETKVTRPARGVFFYLKVLVVFGALLAFSAFIAVYYVYHQLTTDSRLEQMVMEKVSSAIQMDVKFESVSVTFPGIDIRNVTVATSTEELKVDSRIALIKIRPDLWAAFSGELLIDSLSVSSASTNVDILKAASRKDSTPVASQDGRPFDLSGVAFPFNSIDLSAIRFAITDHTAKTTHELLVNNAGLSRSLLSTAIPFNIDTVLAGKAEFKADGKLYWPSSVIADIDLKALDVNELKKLIPEQHRRHLEFVKGASARAAVKYNLVDGSLSLDSCHVQADPGLQADGSVKVSTFTPLNASASFKILPMPVDDIWPMIKAFVPAEHGLVLKNGRVSAEIDAAVSDSAPLKIAVALKPENVEVQARALPEKIQIGRGLVRYDGSKVSFSGFEARMSDTLIKMTTGSLALDPVAFSGDLAAEVNFDSVWKLVSSHLSPEAKRVVPGGKASFDGNLVYDKKGFRVDGTLSSDQIKLSEQKTSAQAILEKIRIQFSDLGPTTGQVKVESLEVKGVGAVVKISGVLKNAKDMGFDFAAAGNLSIDEFSKLGAGLFKLPVREGQFKGDLTLDVKLGGTMSNLKPQGKLEFKNVYADVSERGLVISNLNGAASADSDKLLVDKLSAELLGGNMTLSGSLNNFKKPVADARAAISGADLAAIRKLIKINYPEMPDEIEFSGLTDLNVNLTGSVAEPVLKGDAVLKACRFAHPAVFRPIENINGPVSFNNGGLTTSGLRADWGSSKALVNGQLKDWAKFVTDFKFSVDPLDLTDAAGFFLKGSGYVVEGKGTGSGSITGAVEKIKVDGVASIPAGLFAAPVSAKGDLFKFPYKNLTARAVYFDKVLNVNSAELDLFSGKVNASGKVFLANEPITFEFDTKVKSLMTQEFLAINSSYKNVVQGGLDGSFVAKGNTNGLATLNGNASLAMPKGSYNSPPVVKQISQQLNAEHLASGTIENVAGDYVISGGRITSKNTVGKSKDGKVTFVGSVGLDATLDGEAQFQIKREACQQSKVLRDLVGNAEFLEIPISLKGSFMSPSVGIPLDRMLQKVAERKVKDSLQKEAGKALGKLFGIKSEPAGQVATPAAPVSTEAPVIAPSIPAPAGQIATSTPTPAPAPVPPPTPQKKIEDKIKDIGKDLKDLKKIFKF